MNTATQAPPPFFPPPPVRASTSPAGSEPNCPHCGVPHQLADHYCSNCNYDFLTSPSAPSAINGHDAQATVRPAVTERAAVPTSLPQAAPVFLTTAQVVRPVVHSGPDSSRGRPVQTWIESGCVSPASAAAPGYAPASGLAGYPSGRHSAPGANPAPASGLVLPSAAQPLSPAQPSGPPTSVTSDEAQSVVPPGVPAGTVGDAGDPTALPSALQVVITTPDQQPVAVQLKESELLIGKAPPCNVALTKDPYVSRRHGQITYQGGVVKVNDLGSANGTFLRVRRPIVLEPGDEVVMGTTILRIEPAVR